VATSAKNAAPIAESHKARRERVTSCSSCLTIAPHLEGGRQPRLDEGGKALILHVVRRPLCAVGRSGYANRHMSEAAISIRDLQKTYAGGKRALDGVSLDVPRGQIFGLLGPNGAGKSTLINILAGLVNKSGGSAEIWGFDIEKHPRNAKASIGIVPQEILFDPFFTPAETLELQAGLYGVPKARRRTMELLRAVHLEDKADAYSRTLSGGMKRRLLVAKAMVHSPPILVLDEPTAGVDIELRQQLWAYVRSLNAEGVTVVLTTHYLEEAEELCDRIAIINHGRLIANETTRTLVGMAQEKAVEVTVDRDLTSPPEAPCFDKIELKGERTLAITYRKDRVNAGDVLAALQKDGLGIVDVSTREADLEDVFLNLTRASNANA
jgi:ABC-2 type transport system ATP-binding protein